MKYFFDTEFIEDGRTIDLLSIGIVAEDGQELYLCNQDATINHADEWVIWNVYPYLPLKHSDRWYWNARKIDVNNRSNSESIVVPRYEIRDRIVVFVEQGMKNEKDKPEFWGYYADYDWVVLAQLFGRMVDLPKGWPMYCRDVKQLCDSMGNPKLPKNHGEHHALSDARWTKEAYEFLIARADRIELESN